MTNRRRIREGVAFLVLCFAVLAACKKKEGDTCGSNSDCKEGLLCIDADWPESKCLSEAAARAACRAAKVCTENGKCSASRTGNCSAETDEDCAQSNGCKTGGACKASGAGYCK